MMARPLSAHSSSVSTGALHSGQVGSSYYSCSMVIIVMHTLLTLLEPLVLIQ